MCHVNGGGTFVLILIELCLLEHYYYYFLNYIVYWKRITFTNKIVRQCMARIQRKNVNKIIRQCMVGIQRKNVNKNIYLRKIKIYLVFTRILNFLGGKLELTHAFSHFYLTFLKFLAKLCTFANHLGQLS